MVELVNVSKTFGSTKAVDDVSFKITEGENLILLGTSGCGKTTTLKMINRLIEPDSGTITINGKNILDQKKEVLRRSIGYVMQNNGLFPHYTVAQNIGVLPSLLKWDANKTARRTLELIEKLHLPEEMLTMYPDQLSGGQQQRVGLARALVADTPLLLMDEPFGALDNVTRTQIQNEFKALDEFKNKTIIMVTHDVQEAFELADRIALMEDGKIIQIGTPKELLYRPVNKFATEFLDGQRLALELKMVTMADLWNDFNLMETTNSKSNSCNLSVWEAMETFREDKAKTINFAHENGETKTIDFEGLTTAFRRYQIAQDHG